MLTCSSRRNELAKAASIALSDINTGDRVLARANQIVVMSKSDLQQKQAAERAEWQKRGAAGKIVASRGRLDHYHHPGGPEDKCFYHSENHFPAICAGVGPLQRRESRVRFADMKVGDQVRVLGDKTG